MDQNLSVDDMKKRWVVEKYKELLFTTGLLTKEAAATLKVSEHEIECQHCRQKLRLALLRPCTHKICVNCLDGIFDLYFILGTPGKEKCPVCMDPIVEHEYLTKTEILPRIYTH